MRDRRTWVLVTDGGHGGSRDCLAAVRALHAGGYRSGVTVSPGASRAAVSRHAARRLAVPGAGRKGYVEAIASALEVGPYLTVLPVSEASLLALGSARADLTDKRTLHFAATAAGIEVPPSLTFESPDELLAASPELDYPAAVKPAVRTFSAFRADSPVALEALKGEDGTVVVQPWLDEDLRAISGVVWKGEMVAAAHERWLRIWPHPAGLASAAETIEPDIHTEGRLIELLEGYDGVFCAQFAGPYLFDLNLRVHSSHPLAVRAGANLVATYCDLLNGDEVLPVRASPGHFYRWLEGDLRSVLKGLRAGRISVGAAVAALRPHRGAAHSTESLTDPLPFLTRLAYGMSRAHLSAEERKGALEGVGSNRGR